MRPKGKLPGGSQHQFAQTPSDNEERLQGIIGLGKFSARKNYYPELQKKIKELQKARSYITNIIDSMPSVLVGVDAELKVTQWNKTAEQVTGIASADACGRLLDALLPYLDSLMETVGKSIETGDIKTEHHHRSVGDNQVIYEDVTVYPLLSNGVEGAVIRIDDVTEKIQIQEMMLQNEKMLSVGGLAAGMAHEINNPLAGMIQTANVMANRIGGRMDIPANVKAATAAGTTLEAIAQFMDARDIPRMIKAITESGRRVAQIVDNMLSFSRKSDILVSSRHDLTALLDKTLELASTDYDLKKQYDFKTIGIVKKYDENLPQVSCDHGKIQQVLLNILRNGAQAMQETRKDREPKFILRVKQERTAPMQRIEIEDNGPGMAESVRKRVFEPFFTTKPPGVGTGLGMSVSYFIIRENHNGELLVESVPGRGSRFIIRLPAGQEK